MLVFVFPRFTLLHPLFSLTMNNDGYSVGRHGHGYANKEGQGVDKQFCLLRRQTVIHRHAKSSYKCRRVLALKLLMNTVRVHVFVTFANGRCKDKSPNNPCEGSVCFII